MEAVKLHTVQYPDKQVSQWCETLASMTVFMREHIFSSCSVNTVRVLIVFAYIAPAW